MSVPGDRSENETTTSSAEKQLETEPVEGAKHVADAPSQPDFPDGGATAWITVFGAWLALFSTYGYTNAFGVYQDYYTRFYLNNVTPSAISWIGTFQLFVPLILGMPIGRLFDAGYFRVLMPAGSILFVFSLFMLSLTKPHQYYQIFLSQAIGMGLGLGLVFTPSVSISSQYFRRKRALAVGIALSGSSVGAVIHPIMLNRLFSNPSVGFAAGTRASAYMVLGCLIIANLTMRTRLPPRSSVKLTSLSTLFKDWPYVMTITGAFFVQITSFFPMFYIQLYSVTHGIEENLAFYSVAMLNAGSIIGRIIPTLIADKVGAFQFIIPTTVICGGLMFALLGITNVASMAVVAILYGVASGAYLALAVAIAASLARSPSEIGLRTGVAFSTNSFAALVGIPIAGELLTKELLWLRAIIFSAVCVFVGAVFLFGAFYMLRHHPR